MGWPRAQGAQPQRTRGPLPGAPRRDPGASTQHWTTPPGKVRTSTSRPLAPASPSGRGAVAMATGPHPTPTRPRRVAPQSRGGRGLRSRWSPDGGCRARERRNAGAGEDEEVRKAEVAWIAGWGPPSPRGSSPFTLPKVPTPSVSPRM